MKEKALSGMMSQERRRDDDMKKRISQFEEEVARLRIQLPHYSYTFTAIEDEVHVLLLY